MNAFEQFNPKQKAKLEGLMNEVAEEERKGNELLIQQARTNARLDCVELLKEKEGLKIKLELLSFRKQNPETERQIVAHHARIAEIDQAVMRAEEEAEASARARLNNE